ncbi:MULTISPECIES: lmo0937 family membrane protein [unclassified Bacillus (in: firmicutes)]|nr:MULTISPECIES: lmo0937 family membrane protein [unclassified Bacillus (in: firmicutes)]
MLWTIVGLLVLFWIVGLLFDIAGGLIHLLLVAAVVVFLFNMFKNRANR